MTKGELMKALEGFSDDTKVKIVYADDNDFRELHTIKYIGVNNMLIFESDDVPNDDGITELAAACLHYHKKDMSPDLIKKYEDFLS